MAKLSIIVPVYYNEQTLETLYDDMAGKLLPLLPDYEIVMVDDGSGDRSWEIMQTLAARDLNIRLVRLSRNFGSHAACLAGFSVCTGDCAMIKAADLQEPSELIYEMYERWLLGKKVVLAVRSDRKENFSQKLFAGLYYRLVQRLALPSMPSGGFDCYLIDRRVIEILKLLDEKNSALTLQILWVGFSTDMVYYVREERRAGKSKWTLSKKIKLVIDSLVGFSFFPIRFVSVLGVVFFLVSVLWGIYVLLFRLFGDIVVEGWTTLMILTLFSSGLVMLTLGVLGEYVWRGMDASRNRPVFIVDEFRDGKKETPEE